MNNPRLTIAIPSYNRAQKLDAQLAWAVGSIGENWDECELLISDNASADDTPGVCEKWRYASGDRLRVIRQQNNIGLARNVLACIQEAKGSFVWVVGDDDPILPGTFPWVLDHVRRASPAELGYILLNFSTTDGYAGTLVQERIFPIKEDRLAAPGIPLFEECAQIDEGGMLLISANIYSTAIAQAAILRWPAMADNLAFPLFLSGYACAHAGMLVRAEPSLIYPHHTGSHLHTWLNTVFYDIPVAYLALLKEDYSVQFIRPRILSRASFLVFAARFPKQFLKALNVYFRAARLKQHKG